MTIDKLARQAEIWNVLRDVPDNFPLDAEHAALYMGLSISTLAQRRSNGLPPPYEQLTPGKGGKVKYKMGALRALSEKNGYTNTTQAVQEKIFGRNAVAAFMADSGEHGFWIEQGSNLILDSVYGDALDFKLAFISQDDYGLVHKSWHEVLQMPWKNEERLMHHVWLYCNQYPEQGSQLTELLRARASL